METTRVGSEVSRIDGQAKANGTAIYGDDITMKNMLYGVCRYVDIPAGLVESLDLTEALKVPGVVKIATWDDVPGQKKIGVVHEDYPPIIDKEIAYSGDVMAIIAAETYEAACIAAEKIKVTYIPWEPITSMEEAIKPGARLVHGDKKDNIINHHHTLKGNVDEGFAASTRIFEREYRVNFQEHGYIEPESITTYISPSENIMTVAGSIQNAHRIRGMVAKYLNLPQAKVNVKRSVLGGSFGGKDDIIDNLACRAALLTHLTGRPVKFSYNREQSMRESYKRHPYIMKYKIGVDDQARIQAIDIDILAEGGAYSGQTVFVTWRSSVQAAGPYNIPNVRIELYGVYTNNNYTSAYRGFGAPQVIFANETLMDEVAADLGLSPIEFRRINILKQNDISIAGQKMSEHTVSAEQVMMTAIENSDYLQKRAKYEKLNAQGGPIKYGIGFAISHRGCSLGAEGLDASSALIQINADGSINISTSVSENGQGLQTTMSIITANAFGLDIDRVMFCEPDTSMIADGGSTVASRGTLMGGQAILDAANILKRRIADAIAKDLEVEGLKDLVWENGEVFNKNNPEKRMDFLTATNKARAGGANLAAYGWFVAPSIHWDEEKGCGSPYFTWVYGCQLADIEVDTRTGKIKIKEVTAVHDVGKVINKVGFEGQVCGGVLQGMVGYGMLEDFNIENGKVKSENFDTYLLPTIKDMPNINVIAVENYDKVGPNGAKVIGEPVLELGAAALNNAVNFALGKWNRQIPLTLEQVRLGYNLKKPVRQSELLAEAEEGKQVHRLNTLRVTLPKTLNEALEALQKKGSMVIAGGTDVLIQARMKTNQLPLVNIAGLKELQYIAEKDGGLIVGAGVCISDFVNHPLAKKYYPEIVMACQSIGSLQLRNRATIGGNIVNASPSADSVPPLIARDAEVELQSLNGKRRFLLNDFIVGGYRTKIEPGELLANIIIPAPRKNQVYSRYLALGRRNAVNITRQSFTMHLSFDRQSKIDYCRLVDGALMSKPQRLTPVEDFLLNNKLERNTIDSALAKLKEMLDKAIGNRWSAPYKIPVAIDMLEQILLEIQHDYQKEVAV